MERKHEVFVHGCEDVELSPLRPGVAVVRTSNEFLFCRLTPGQREDMFATDDGFSGGKSPLAIFPNVNEIQFFDKPLLRHSRT
jgi:hypothetical protein